MRRAALVTLVSLGLLAAGGTLAPTPATPAFAAQDPVQDDAVVQGAIDQIEVSLKINDEAKVNAKLVEMEKSTNPKWLAYLLKLATKGKSDSIAQTAMAHLGTHKDPAFLKWAKGNLDDKKAFEDRKPNPRYVAMLKALAFYGDDLKPLLGDLEDVIKKYMSESGEIAGAAIRAYGSCRTKPMVDTMLKWLLDAENTKGGGQGGKISETTRAAKNLCSTAINEALKTATGQDLADHRTWNEWWEANKKEFKFPDLNAAKVDPATLDEYTDVAFGFTVKKPKDPPGFAFQASQAKGGRLEMLYTDPQGVRWSKVKWVTYKADTKTPDITAFFKHIEEKWRTKEFEKFSREPVIEDRKIGGKDFKVLIAKGLVNQGPEKKGDWWEWESVELRFYVFMPNTGTFVYADLGMRNSSEDNVKQASINSIEGMTFRK